MNFRIPLLVAILCSLLSRAGLGQESASERWYEFSIGGVPCGYLHRSVSFDEGVCETQATECIRIKRNGFPVRLETSRLFLESPDSGPVSSTFSQSNGGVTRSSSIVFSDQTLLLTSSRAHGESSQTLLTDPGGWLTPRQVSALIRDRIASGSDRIEYRVLRSAGKPGTIQEIRMNRLPNGPPLQPRSPNDVRSGVTCWQVQREGESLELLEWRDSAGLLLESRMETGLGLLRSHLSTREAALRALDAPAPELMQSTFVDVASMPRRSDRIVTAGYRVRLDWPSEELGNLPMTSGAQRVRGLGDQVFEFEIDASRGSLVTAEELASPIFIESSQVLDSSDPELKAFTDRVLRNAADDPMQRAELLRVAVDRHILSKSLSSGMDTASEVLRSRSGDCTEHAVLLAAALRCDGIPSRVAIGLVHAPVGAAASPVFVWHMWTQGLIADHWYDFDPTRPHRFDGGHLLVALDALSDRGGGQPMGALLGLVGRLQIAVFMVDGVAVGSDDKRSSP